MTKDFNVSVSMDQAAAVKTGVILKQGDFGFDLKITVLDFVVTGTTPQIVFRKAMGAVESTDVTASGNVYTYTFKGTELDVPGKVFCDLKLKNSTTQRISTASFQFEVVADTLDGLAEEASSYSDTIEQLLENTLQKSETAGLVKNDGSIDSNEYLIKGTFDNIVNNSKFISKKISMFDALNCKLTNLSIENGDIINTVTDSKDYITLHIIQKNTDDTTTLLVNTNITNAGNYLYIKDIPATVKSLIVKHNGSTKDLIIESPIHFEETTRVRIGISFKSVNPSTANGLIISDLSFENINTGFETNTLIRLKDLNIAGGKFIEKEVLSGGITNIYIKGVSGSNAFTNQANTSLTRTVSELLSDLGAAASLTGDELKITLNASERLWYDYENNRFLITAGPVSYLPYKNCLLLVGNWYGDLRGSWVDQTSYKKVLALEEKEAKDLATLTAAGNSKKNNYFNPIISSFSSMTIKDSQIINDKADSGRNFFRLWLVLVNEDESETRIENIDITEPQIYEKYYRVSQTCKAIKIIHNGSSRNFSIITPMSLERNTLMLIRIDFRSINASAVNGVIIDNISLEDAETGYESLTKEGMRHLIIPRNPMPVFTPGTGGILTVDIPIASESDVFTDTFSTSNTISISQILQDLSGKATYSDGILSIQLGVSERLVYDYKEIKLKVISSSITSSISNTIMLVLNWYGNIYGDWVNKAAYMNVLNANSRIDDISRNVELPDYFVSEINDTANKLSKLPTSNFNYIVFTDIHYSYPADFTKTKLNNLMESIERLANGAHIDAVLFLGDLIEGGALTDRSANDNAINAVFEGLRGVKKPILCAFGNHDNGMYDFTYDRAEGYRNTDHYITIEEWKNKAVLPFGYKSDCYCQDFPDYNIRLIVTNTCDYQETIDQNGNVSINDRTGEIMIRKNSLDKIADMLSETNKNVIIYTHGLVLELFELVSTFNTNGTYTKANEQVIDFSGKTNKILLYHTGHYHNSAMEYNADYHVNILSTSCASMASSQQTLYAASPTTFVSNWEDQGPVAWNNRVIPRTKNTINETCFDVVSIGNGKINKIGFGASNDDTLNI